MTADDRRFEVLRAIVSDYVATREPVGSKSLVDRHHLGVSPATIRNDMAVLEDEGYIAQPHTSAGRIPTDKGYRMFVDRLSQVKPLSAGERKAIQAFLSEAVDLDDVLRRSVRLLAQLTRQVAVVQYPTLARSLVRHVEAVALDQRRLLLVVITDTGRVEQRLVELDADITDDALTTLRSLLATQVSGRRLADAASAVTNLAALADPAVRHVVVPSVSVLLDALVEHPEERLVLSGTSHATGAWADSAGQPARRAGGAGRAGDVAQVAGRAGEPGCRDGVDRPGERRRQPVDVGAGVGRLRQRQHVDGRARRGRTDPDGLSGNDGRGPRGRPLCRRDRRRSVTIASA